jgi:hypothetical protein
MGKTENSLDSWTALLRFIPMAMATIERNEKTGSAQKIGPGEKSILLSRERTPILLPKKNRQTRYITAILMGKKPFEATRILPSG